MLLFLIFQLIFGAVGMELFEDSYQRDAFTNGTDPYRYLNNSCADEDGLVTGECELPEWVFKSFDSFWHTHITLLVLLSSENYPWVFWPPYNIDRANTIYFVAWLLFAYFFVMNILLALVFQQYNDGYLSILKGDEKRERKALEKAWQLLDERQNQALPVSVIEKVIEKIHPDYSRTQVLILAGLVEQAEWNTLVDKLFIEIKDKPKSAWGGVTNYF